MGYEWVVRRGNAPFDMSEVTEYIMTQRFALTGNAW
jgi:hypothetical protein